MLINEVANTYESENDQKQAELKDIIINKDKVIAKLRAEIRNDQEKMVELQSKVYSEQQAFARLHETYLILEHHNEEGLSLRLQTEGRLKELFRRDRQNQEVLKKVRIDRKNDRQEARENDAKIKELEDLVFKLEESNREKEGINMLIKEELTA